MATMQFNFKTGKLEPVKEYLLQRGQIILWNDSIEKYVIFEVDNVHSIIYNCVNLRTFKYHKAQYVRPIEQKFGIGHYFKAGEIMSEEEILKCLEKAKEVALKDYEEAERKKDEMARLYEIGKAKFEEAIAKYGEPKALLVAELHQDESDSMTDYFNFRTTKTVILAFSKHKRDLFPEMRKAALKSDNPEIRELAEAPAEWENRDKYSMGSYYLAKSTYSGWCIKKHDYYPACLHKFYVAAAMEGGFCV